MKLVIGYWLLVISFVSGCATIYNPATQKEELILIDTQTEVFLGRHIDAQISQAYDVVRGAEVNERVNIIGRKIALVSDRQDLKYIFKVAKDKEINAFSTPGGFIYVNTGLLDKVDDDELACVLGHEVGHIAARHIVKKLQAQMGYELLMSLAFRKGGARDIERALNITFNIISLGYSREDEFLADKLAIKYAYKAGYEPEAIVRFFKKLQELKKDKAFATPLFLRSHPYLDQRIKHAEGEIARLEGVVTESLAVSPAVITPKPTSTSVVSSVPPVKPLTEPTFKPKPESKQLGKQNKPLFLYKNCPQCGHNYPRSYQYCPKDGTELTF